MAKKKNIGTTEKVKLGINLEHGALVKLEEINLVQTSKKWTQFGHSEDKPGCVLKTTGELRDGIKKT
ncbi:MAG: hypothetical protein ACYSRP_06310 [Planctomycetota bacterium]